MTATTLQRYRRKLEAIAARLADDLTVIQGEAFRPTGSSTNGSADDLADPAEQTAAEGVALTLLGAEGQTLAEVNAALKRIELGTFGQCEGCGGMIHKDRLTAIPYTRYCIACAQK